MKAKTTIICNIIINVVLILWIVSIYQTDSFRSGAMSIGRLVLAILILLTNFSIIIYLYQKKKKVDYTLLFILLTLFNIGLLLKFRCQSIPTSISPVAKEKLVQQVKNYYVLPDEKGIAFSSSKKQVHLAPDSLFPSVVSIVGMLVIIFLLSSPDRFKVLVQFKCQLWGFLAIIIGVILLSNLFYKFLSPKIVTLLKQLLTIPMVFLLALMFSYLKNEMDKQYEHREKKIYHNPPKLHILLFYLLITSIPGVIFMLFKDPGVGLMYGIIITYLFIKSQINNWFVLLAPIAILIWLSFLFTITDQFSLNIFNPQFKDWNYLINLDISHSYQYQNLDIVNRFSHLYSASNSGLFGYGPEIVLYPHKSLNGINYTFANLMNLMGILGALLIIILYIILFLKSQEKSEIIRSRRKLIDSRYGFLIFTCSCLIFSEPSMHILSTILFIPESRMVMPFIDHSPVAILVNTFLLSIMIFFQNSFGRSNHEFF